MTLRHLFKTSISGLNSHKSRSILTILGIVIGITAIMLVIALGRGAENLILGQIQGIGSRVLVAVPGRQPTGPTDFLSTFTDSLKERDLELLRNRSNVPHATKIMPLVFGSQTAAYENEIYRPTIFGATDMFASIYDVFPSEGRLMNDDEVKGFADVAIIGREVKDELFGTTDPIGQKIKIRGRNFRVIGILPKTGQLSFANFDKAIFMPYTTAQQYVFGKKYFDRLVIEARDEEHVAETENDVIRTLRTAHNITDPDKDDFFIETPADAVATVGTVTSVLTLFLASVAGISLLVGGVGIMNIMLVSVTERTREIGLRKALGATNSDIMRQFLLEAVLLTAIGGFVGILLGTLLAWLISLVLSNYLGLAWQFIFPTSAALLGLGVSAGVGLVFGLYPARQASKKSPIEALRYE
jgi:putative ABC transport system permease protein